MPKVMGVWFLVLLLAGCAAMGPVYHPATNETCYDTHWPFIWFDYWLFQKITGIGPETKYCRPSTPEEASLQSEPLR